MRTCLDMIFVVFLVTLSARVVAHEPLRESTTTQPSAEANGVRGVSESDLLPISWKMYTVGALPLVDLLLCVDLSTELNASRARLTNEKSAVPLSSKVSILKELVRVCAERRKAGLAPESEVARARLALASAEVALAKVRGDSRVERVKLAESIQHATELVDIAGSIDGGRASGVIDASIGLLRAKYAQMAATGRREDIRECLSQIRELSASSQRLAQRRYEAESVDLGEVLLTTYALSMADARLASFKNDEMSQQARLVAASDACNKLVQIRQAQFDVFHATQAVMWHAEAMRRLSRLKRDRKGELEVNRNCAVTLSQILDNSSKVQESGQVVWIAYANACLALARNELLVPSGAIGLTALDRDPPGSRRYLLNGETWYRSPSGTLFVRQNQRWLRIGETSLQQ